MSGEDDVQVVEKEIFELFAIFSDGMSENFVDWFQDEFYESSSAELLFRFLCEFFGFFVEIVIAPKEPFESFPIDLRIFLNIFLHHRVKTEHERVFT